MHMSTAKTYRTLAVVVPLIVLSFYQACGRVGFDVSKGGSANFASQGVCENQLKAVYQSTFFPMLRVSCNRCHGNAHGSTDLNTSYSGFMAKGASLIEYKATHPHGDNGIDLTNQIASVKPQWNAGQDVYLACLASGGGAGGSKLRANAKKVTGIEMTMTNQAQWKSIEWDLDTEVPMEMQGQFGAFLKIEARLALQSGSVVGFEFRNPMMRLKSTGKNIQVSGMSIYLNNTFQPNVTTYAGLTMVVDKTTDVALAPGASIALDWFPGADKETMVALEFSNIQLTDQSGIGTGGGTGSGGTTPNGSPVTFAQLISTDVNLGIFKRSCMGCHSGGNLGGGLDLSDYNAAKANASGIQSRMNNAANPMPKSGLLPQADRDVVSRWINAGSPQ